MTKKEQPKKPDRIPKGYFNKKFRNARKEIDDFLGVWRNKHTRGTYDLTEDQINKAEAIVNDGFDKVQEVLDDKCSKGIDSQKKLDPLCQEISGIVTETKNDLQGLFLRTQKGNISNLKKRLSQLLSEVQSDINQKFGLPEERAFLESCDNVEDLSNFLHRQLVAIVCSIAKNLISISQSNINFNDKEKYENKQHQLWMILEELKNVLSNAMYKILLKSFEPNSSYRSPTYTEISEIITEEFAEKIKEIESLFSEDAENDANLQDMLTILKQIPERFSQMSEKEFEAYDPENDEDCIECSEFEECKKILSVRGMTFKTFFQEQIDKLIEANSGTDPFWEADTPNRLKEAKRIYERVIHNIAAAYLNSLMSEIVKLFENLFKESNQQDDVYINIQSAQFNALQAIAKQIEKDVMDYVKAFVDENFQEENGEGVIKNKREFSVKTADMVFEAIKSILSDEKYKAVLDYGNRPSFDLKGICERNKINLESINEDAKNLTGQPLPERADTAQLEQMVTDRFITPKLKPFYLEKITTRERESLKDCLVIEFGMDNEISISQISEIVSQLEEDGKLEEWARLLNDEYHGGYNLRTIDIIRQEVTSIIKEDFARKIKYFDDEESDTDKIENRIGPELQERIDAVLEWYEGLPETNAPRLARMMIDRLAYNLKTSLNTLPTLHIENYVRKLELFRDKERKYQNGKITFPIDAETAAELILLPQEVSSNIPNYREVDALMRRIRELEDEKTEIDNIEEASKAIAEKVSELRDQLRSWEAKKLEADIGLEDLNTKEKEILDEISSVTQDPELNSTRKAEKINRLTAELIGLAPEREKLQKMASSFEEIMAQLNKKIHKKLSEVDFPDELHVRRQHIVLRLNTLLENLQQLVSDSRSV